MNRRAFLIGLGATAAVVQLPTKILEVAADTKWAQAVQAVINRYITDFVCYGQGMLLYNEEWPFVHNVDPTTIQALDLGPGLDHLGRVIQ